MGRPERLVLLVCTLACLAASATAFRRADGVVNALIGENVIEPTEQPAVERETSPAPAAVVPIADLPYRFKGVSFLEAAQAPTVASVGNGRNGRPCKNGFGCIYETGVCCEGGEVCCEYACRSTNPPTCGPTVGVVSSLYDNPHLFDSDAVNLDRRTAPANCLDSSSQEGVYCNKVLNPERSRPFALTLVRSIVGSLRWNSRRSRKSSMSRTCAWRARPARKLPKRTSRRYCWL